MCNTVAHSSVTFKSPLQNTFPWPFSPLFAYSVPALLYWSICVQSSLLFFLKLGRARFSHFRLRIALTTNHMSVETPLILVGFLILKSCLDSIRSSLYWGAGGKFLLFAKIPRLMRIMGVYLWLSWNEEQRADC